MTGKSPLPTLILPGFMADARAFAPQIATLSATRAVQVAVPIHGDTIEAMAEEVLSGAPPSFALLGHGLGGIVAIEIMARSPERVDRLALIGTNPLPEAPSHAGAREARIIAARGGRLEDALFEEVPSQSLAPGPGRLAVQNTMRSMVNALGSDVFEQQSRALMRRGDRQRILRSVRVPTQIIGGRHDTWSPPRRHEFMAELIPDAEIEIIECAGHYPMLETPDVMTAMLERWLNGTLLLV